MVNVRKIAVTGRSHKEMDATQVVSIVELKVALEASYLIPRSELITGLEEAQAMARQAIYEMDKSGLSKVDTDHWALLLSAVIEWVDSRNPYDFRTPLTLDPEKAALKEAGELPDSTYQPGESFGGMEYIRWRKGGRGVTLDGDFTVEQLEQLVMLMRSS